MKYPWTIAVLVVFTVLPPPVRAQDPPREKAAPRAFNFSFSRGRIGVIVKTDADAQADQIGARIEAVSPGGPAEKAGLKAGDVITRFNGVSLAGADAVEKDASGPGLKLVRLAQALDPGDTVRVEYRRGTENRSATVVAQDIGSSWSSPTPRPLFGRGEFRIDPDIRLHLGEEGRGIVFGRPWSQLDLVSLNPDLAEYFGTQEGVLVVKAPDDESLLLKGGDVIVSIGGRKPTSPSHAMRILGSYETGETVNIDVMRKQKRTTITWKVPEREDRRFKRRQPRDREEQTEFRPLPRSRIRLQET